MLFLEKLKLFDLGSELRHLYGTIFSGERRSRPKRRPRTSPQAQKARASSHLHSLLAHEAALLFMFGVDGFLPRPKGLGLGVHHLRKLVQQLSLHVKGAMPVCQLP